MAEQEQKMESIVVCPACGEQVYLQMSPYRQEKCDLMKIFESVMNIGNTEHFEGNNKCKCGKTVHATLHITAEG